MQGALLGVRSHGLLTQVVLEIGSVVYWMSLLRPGIIEQHTNTSMLKLCFAVRLPYAHVYDWMSYTDQWTFTASTVHFMLQNSWWIETRSYFEVVWADCFSELNISKPSWPRID